MMLFILQSLSLMVVGTLEYNKRMERSGEPGAERVNVETKMIQIALLLVDTLFSFNMYICF